MNRATGDQAPGARQPLAVPGAQTPPRTGRESSAGRGRGETSLQEPADWAAHSQRPQGLPACQPTRRQCSIQLRAWLQGHTAWIQIPVLPFLAAKPRPSYLTYQSLSLSICKMAFCSSSTAVRILWPWGPWEQGLLSPGESPSPGTGLKLSLSSSYVTAQRELALPRGRVSSDPHRAGTD